MHTKVHLALRLKRETQHSHRKLLLPIGMKYPKFRLENLKTRNSKLEKSKLENA